jgi:hypothetical protein
VKEFTHLEPEARIEAVLAATNLPMTRDILLQASSVDISRVSEDSRARVENLFSVLQGAGTDADESTDKTMDKAIQRDPVYFISPDKKSAVLKRLDVDERSVRLHVADVGDAFLDQLE